MYKAFIKMSEQKFTSAAPMIRLKIKLNEKLAEFYEAQLKGFELEQESIFMDIQASKNRLRALNSVNRIEKLQLDEFSEERAADINSITVDTNKMNIDDAKNKESIHRSMQVIVEKIEVILQEADQIKKQIPVTGVVQNYTVSNC